MTIESNKIYESLGLTHDKKKTIKNDQSELGQEDFMKLMVTQMSNQDPFKPMDNAEFISQMAQFSSVNSLSDLTESFGSLASSMQSSQALQASSLVGRNILAPSNGAILPDGGTVEGAVDLPFSATDLTVKIFDTEENLVRTIEIEEQGAGLNHFEWDGLDQNGNQMPAGTYAIEGSASQDGTPYALETLVSVKVDSVSLGQGGRGVSLNVAGLGSLGLSAVRQIL